MTLASNEVGEIVEEADHKDLGGHGKNLRFFLGLMSFELWKSFEQKRYRVCCALKGSPDAVLKPACRVARVETRRQEESPTVNQVRDEDVVAVEMVSSDQILGII